MNTLFAVVDQNYAWIGMVPVGIIVVGLIINVSSLHSKDMNRKSGLATNLFFIALLVEAAAWMVRAFGGGTETGVFWTVAEHRAIGRWPHGRRRAIFGFWLNVIALLVIAAWFYLGTNPKLYKRIFE
jgi:hypothetical protein